jgi:hypothetical protein
MDIFYIDESNDRNNYVVTAIAVPFLRQVEGLWHIVWPDYFTLVKEWRKGISSGHSIPTAKELHGVKLASGRGNYKFGNRQMPRQEAIPIYAEILKRLSFLPEASVLSASGRRDKPMYGKTRLERVMHVLFQRMRSQCAYRRAVRFWA